MDEAKQQRQDKMTTPERMHALITRERPDRVPFIPFIFGFCALNVGYTVHDLYADPEKSFWAQIWTAEMFGWDAGPLYGYASFGGWEFGGDIKMPESHWEAAPVVTRFPGQTPEDVEALEVPEVENARSLSHCHRVCQNPATVRYVGLGHGLCPVHSGRKHR